MRCPLCLCPGLRCLRRWLFLGRVRPFRRLPSLVVHNRAQFPTKGFGITGKVESPNSLARHFLFWQIPHTAGFGFRITHYLLQTRRVAILRDCKRRF